MGSVSGGLRGHNEHMSDRDVAIVLSGGPMVDGRGRVVATIFAATTSGPRGGYGVPNAVVKRVLAGAREAVSTGPCAR